MQRRIAYEILCKSFIDGQYANLGLKARLNELKPIQRGLVTELVNGVLRNYNLLEYQFSDLVNDKTKLETKIILAMSTYERFYLGVDDYVVVNEYVALGKSKAEKGFLNAVLRKIKDFREPKDDSVESLSIKYSIPLWLVKMLKSQYSEEEFKFYLEDLENEPKLYYRINPKKANVELLSHLEIEMLDERTFTSKFNLINTDEFKNGLFYIQDYNSGKIVDYLDLKPEHKYLDVCSAPGAKLFNALEVVDEANAYANDLHEHRVELIRNRAKSLGYEGINYWNIDATLKVEGYEEYFDRILIDAPCSGLGVIKRKPDLRYHITPNDIDDIVKLQIDILDNMATLLKVNGVMVYSTCTINTKENHRQVANFLKRHDNFELVEDTMLQDLKNSDRFYVAKLLKVR